jgi:hypothetical protein
MSNEPQNDLIWSTAAQILGSPPSRQIGGDARPI